MNMNTSQIENSDAFGPTTWAEAIDAAGIEMASSAGSHKCSLTTLCWPAMYGYAIAKECSDYEAFILTATGIDQLLCERSIHKNEAPPRGRQRQLLFELSESHLGRCRDHGWETIAPQIDAPREHIDKIQQLLEGMLTNTTPEEAFVRLWAASLVLAAIDRTRTDCLEDGLEPHWHLFEARVLTPAFASVPKKDYPPLLAEWGIQDVAQASLMIVDVQRRLSRKIREMVEQTVDDDLQVGPELNELRRALQGVGMVEAICEPLRWACRVEHDAPSLATDMIAMDICERGAENLFLESPTLEELITAKDCFKTLRLLGERGADRRMGVYLYLVAIATAMIQYDKRISRQSNDALRRAFSNMRDERHVMRSLRLIADKAMKLLD